MISHTELWNENTLAVYSDRIIDDELEIIGLASINKRGVFSQEEIRIYNECQPHEVYKVRQICKDFLDQRYKEMQKKQITS